MSNTKFYTMKEAMEILRLTYRGLYGNIMRGEIKAIKSTSGRIFIPDTEIKKFLETHIVTKTSRGNRYDSMPTRNSWWSRCNWGWAFK